MDRARGAIASSGNIPKQCPAERGQGREGKLNLAFVRSWNVSIHQFVMEVEIVENLYEIARQRSFQMKRQMRCPSKIKRGEGPDKQIQNFRTISENFNCHIFLASPILFVQKFEFAYRILDATGISQKLRNFLCISKNLRGKSTSGPRPIRPD
jgi:transcription initiation factor TFIID subunit TAF12